MIAGVTLGAAPLDCPAYVEQALNAVGENCSELDRNIACYGNVQVGAAFNPVFAQTLANDYFTRPADNTPITELEELTTSALDLNAEEWGIAILKLQATVPDTLPGQLVTFVLLGDVIVENAVEPETTFEPLPAVASQLREATNLRSGASEAFTRVAALASGTTVYLDGVSADGEWLRATVNERIGWLPRSALAHVPATLPTLTGEERGAMQSFYLSTGIGPPKCNNVTDNVLLVQTPHNMNIELDVNGAQLNVGSTILLRLLPPGDIMELIVLEGRVTIEDGGISGEDVIVRPRERAYVCLGEPRDLGIKGDSANRHVSCAWSKPQRISSQQIDTEWCYLEGLPAQLLTYPIHLGCEEVPPPPPEMPTAIPIGVESAPEAPPSSAIASSVAPIIPDCNGVNGAFRTIVLAGSPYTGARDTDIAGNTYATTACDEEIHGTNAADVIVDGNDRIFTYGGDDTIIAGAGNDYMDGGGGLDTYDASADTAGMTIDLTNLIVTVSGGGVGNDTLENMETITPGSGNDTFILGNNPIITTLQGGGGANTYRFGAGATGNFTIISTSGADIFDFANFGSGINLDLALQGVSQTLAAGLDIILQGSISQVILPTAFGSTVSGDDQDNIIIGGSGIDIIDGRDGNDTIDGGGGNDTLYGGLGSDTIEGGTGNDNIFGGGGCLSDLEPDTLSDMGNDSEDIIVGGGDLICATGNDGNDTITDNFVGVGGIVIGGNRWTALSPGGTDGSDTINVLDGTGGEIYGGNYLNAQVTLATDTGDTINVTGSGITIYGGNFVAGNSNGNNVGNDIITVNGNGNTVYGGNQAVFANEAQDTGADTITIATGTGNTVYGGNKLGNAGCPPTNCDDGADILTDTSGQANTFYGGQSASGVGTGQDSGGDIFNVADGGNPDTIYTGNNNTAGGAATEEAITVIPAVGNGADANDIVNLGNNP